MTTGSAHGLTGAHTVDELADLRARVRRLEDESEIRRVLSTYAFAADAGRADEFVALWADDGRVGPAPDGADRVGHQQLRQFITSPNHLAIQGHCQHHVLTGPTIIRIDGDDAVVEGYSFVVVASDEHSRRTRSARTAAPALNLEHAKFNRWRLTRAGTSWRIRERIGRELDDPRAAGI